MTAIFFAEVSQLWYVLPLVVTVSLVYGATRDEQIGPILHHAFRFGVWVAGFMVALFFLLFVLERAL